MMLQEADANMRVAAWWSLTIVTLVAAFCYPSKRIGVPWRASYPLRKKLDSVLVVSGFSIMVLVGSGVDRSLLRLPSSHAQAANTSAASVTVERPIRSLIKSWWDDERKGMSKGVKIVSTVLVIALALILLLGIVGLACDLSCSGAEDLAAFVLITGMTLLTVGIIFAIRWIWHGKAKRERQRHRSRQRDAQPELRRAD